MKGVRVFFLIFFFKAGDLDKRIQHKHLNQVLLCLPFQENLRRNMADEFKAFPGLNVSRAKDIFRVRNIPSDCVFSTEATKNALEKIHETTLGFLGILHHPSFVFLCFIFFLPKVFQDTPNIVVIMNDDVGYGAPDTFGGPIHTPTLSKLASHGVPR